MLVSRRYGDQDLTARLVGHRYVVAEATVAEDERADEAERRGGRPPVNAPAYLQVTLEALRKAGNGGDDRARGGPGRERRRPGPPSPTGA